MCCTFPFRILSPMSISLIQVCGGGRDLNLALDGWLIYSARLLTLWQKMFKLFKKSFRRQETLILSESFYQAVVVMRGSWAVSHTKSPLSFGQAAWEEFPVVVPNNYGSRFERWEHINIESLLAGYNFDLLPDCRAAGSFVSDSYSSVVK